MQILLDIQKFEKFKKTYYNLRIVCIGLVPSGLKQKDITNLLFITIYFLLSNGNNFGKLN